MIYNDIKYAIETGAVIEIVYKNHDGSDSVRTLSDIQYSAEYGDNYIKALCHLRNEYRTFKIDCLFIIRHQLLKDTFKTIQGHFPLLKK